MSTMESLTLFCLSFFFCQNLHVSHRHYKKIIDRRYRQVETVANINTYIQSDSLGGQPVLRKVLLFSIHNQDFRSKVTRED